MLTATVDFNAISNGLVRGLQEDVIGDDEMIPDALVLVNDGEGNEAFGVLREVRDGLLFAEVDWDSWGPAAAIQVRPAPAPERGPETSYVVTGDVWEPCAAGPAVGSVGKPAERIPVLA